MSEKPVIFISHSSKDGEIANVLKEQIELVLDDVKVFNASNSDAIDISKAWFSNIIENLEAAKVLMVIVSPNSAQSAWVNFEIGYFWKKNGEKSIYPLILQNTPLFGPLTSIQGKSLEKETDIRNVFKTLCGQFGAKEIETNFEAIVSKLRSALSDELSDEEVKVKLKDYLKSSKNWQNKSVFFKELDAELKLPMGMSKQFLEQVVSEVFGYETESKSENSIRFKLTLGKPYFMD